MSQLTSVFLFIRWPAAVGLIAALSLMVLFPEQLHLGTHQTNTPQSPHTQSQERWSGPVSYADAVNHASGGVVNIYLRKHVQVERPINPLYNDPVFRHFFNISDLPQQKRMQAVLGSGVIVTDDGHILTNYHVIVGADEIVVALEDGRNVTARVLGDNPERDLAVLKIDLPDLQPLQISHDTPHVGDVVLAIGNPFGVGKTVTQGIISATKARNLDLNISRFETFIQTDAAIHPGSSGGALVDAHGKLMGINTANLSQSGADGIGFAVPIDIAMQTLNDIRQHGRVVRGWLGVEAGEIDPRVAQESGLPDNSGMVVIINTAEGGPAAKAGLRRGDIIIGIRNYPVKNPEDIERTIKESRPGDSISIEYIRGTHVDSLDVVLQEQPLAAVN